MTNEEIIATIRAEIERRKGICTAQIKANPGQTFPFVMEMTGYDKLLPFLSDLEKSEKPTPASVGLEEEIVRFFGANPIQYIPDWPLLKNTALHFAEWGAEHLKQ